jgi:PAS domain S-box-containing protein
LSRKDGSKVTVEIITHPVKIKDQTLVLGLARDITERKKAEEALKESEEKYRRIFENVQDVFYELSIRGKILEASPSIELLSKGQFKRDDLIGKSMYDFYPDPTERRTLLNVLRERGFVSDFEINLKNRDGSSIPCSISAKIIFDVNKHPEKIIGSMHDITDRKNATEALKSAKEKAEASDKLKTTFLNNISHEVRTPLNGILGFAEIMSQADLSEEEKNLSLSMLFESSDRLLDTITNYMDISLITSRNLTLYKKYFLPEQILRELFAKNELKCSARNLELLLKIPEQTEKLSIYSDPEILSKILSHLLNNAIKFTEKGSINYGYTIHRNELEFFVKDTGTGIGKESLKSVFEHFIKEDRGPLKLTEGSGLGLSISKGLVELLGGKIWVVSERGKGSGFFFTMPVEKVFESHILVPTDVKQKESKTTKSILVAEDDEINFFYLKALLKQNTSADIIHASNGREAIEKFKETTDIELVLMDIKMPVMDGLEATRQIKTINRDVPVIAITAYAMTGDENKALEAGCDGYLTKPINKKMLLEKIAEFISI